MVLWSVDTEDYTSPALTRSSPERSRAPSPARSSSCTTPAASAAKRSPPSPHSCTHFARAATSSSPSPNSSSTTRRADTNRPRTPSRVTNRSRRVRFRVAERSERRGIEARADRNHTRQPDCGGRHDRQNDRMHKHGCLEQADSDRDETSPRCTSHTPPLRPPKYDPDRDGDERERIDRHDPRSRGGVGIQSKRDQDDGRSRGRRRGESDRRGAQQVTTAKQARRGARSRSEPQVPKATATTPGQGTAAAPLEAAMAPVDDEREPPSAPAHALPKTLHACVLPHDRPSARYACRH